MTPLLISLRFYTTSNMYVVQITRVTQAIITLMPRFIKFFDTLEEKTECQRMFSKVANFPRVCGTIDCTHISIRSPGNVFLKL